jgi:hypothetical protein
MMSRSFNSRRGSYQFRSAPSSVRHEECEVKRRAEEARLLHKVMTEPDHLDAFVFPDGRKPKNHHHWL